MKQGQSLIEFILLFILLLLMTWKLGTLFYHQWQKIACAYQTFEATHTARRSLIPITFAKKSTILIETPEFYQGITKCGQWIETVTLPQLEHARWKNP